MHNNAFFIISSPFPTLFCIWLCYPATVFCPSTDRPNVQCNRNQVMRCLRRVCWLNTKWRHREEGLKLTPNLDQRSNTWYYIFHRSLTLCRQGAKERILISDFAGLISTGEHNSICLFPPQSCDTICRSVNRGNSFVITLHTRSTTIHPLAQTPFTCNMQIYWAFILYSADGRFFC